jgi:ribosome-binding factor A
MPSQRQLRVGELVRHALAEMLSRGIVRDPDLERALVTVAEVRVSADLRHAVAFVTLMGAEDPDRIIAALNRNARFIRGQVSPALRQMKYMPDLQFRIDTRFDDDTRIDELLRSDAVSRDLHHDNGGEGSGTDEGDSD